MRYGVALATNHIYGSSQYPITAEHGDRYLSVAYRQDRICNRATMARGGLFSTVQQLVRTAGPETNLILMNNDRQSSQLNGGVVSNNNNYELQKTFLSNPGTLSGKLQRCQCQDFYLSVFVTFCLWSCGFEYLKS